MKKIRKTRPTLCNLLIAAAGASLLFAPQWVHASDGNENEEYITISVDAMDSSGKVTYALDTDDPSAFTEINEFSVPAGTSHIIYVKDEAGNITSQEYPGQAETPPDETYAPNSGEETQTAERGDYHIDIELDTNPSGMAFDTEPAEPGGGNIYDKTKANPDTDSEKVFYTITTDEGEVFYLVIDQEQATNNVYLLDRVKLSDLKALSVDDSISAKEEEKSNSLLDALNNADSPEKMFPEDGDTEQPPTKNNGSTLIILILAVAGGSFYYYMRVYKNKKDLQMDLSDAMEREDFESDSLEDEEVDFELEAGYQESALNRLFEEDEEEICEGDEGSIETNLKEDFIDDLDNLEFSEEEEELL